MITLHRTFKSVTRFLPLFLAATVCEFVACSRVTSDDCAKHIKEKIVQDSTAQSAEFELKKCGFKTTFDPEKKLLYGDKMVPGTVVSERTQVSIQLNADNRVATIVVTNSLTGL